MKKKSIKRSNQSRKKQSPKPKYTSLWTATVEDTAKSPFTKEQQKYIDKVLKNAKNHKIDFSKPTPELQRLIKTFES